MGFKIVETNEFESLKIGGELTIHGDIISNSGYIIYDEGDKVEIENILIIEGRWSNVFNMYIEPKLHAIKIKGQSGHCLSGMFVETQHMKS